MKMAGMQPQRPSARLGPWAGAPVVAALVLASYWPALNGKLLWDDPAHVTRPALQSLHGLRLIWTDVRATQQYYPVLHSAFWAEHRLWGDAPLGYHLANLTWHTLSCCLVMAALIRLGGLRQKQSPVEISVPAGVRPSGGALLAGLLFAVHPVCVESVAWISEQKNTLSLLFYLLAGLAYLSYREKGGWGRYSIGFGLFLLALGTKSVTATLPAALLVVQWWVSGRISWRRDVQLLLPWFVSAVAAGLVTAWIERTVIGASGSAFTFSAGQRVLLASRDLGFYLGRLLWPAHLVFIYHRWDISVEANRWYGYLAAALGVTATLFILRHRTRGPLAAWLFFVGSLFPALGFFNIYPFLFSFVADHFQYLASLGILCAAALGIAGGLARFPPRWRAPGWAVIALLIAALAVRSNLQSRDYRDGETLYRATLAQNPDCWMAHNNLGEILAGTPGGDEEAAAHFRRALQLNPDYADAHNNLGEVLLQYPGQASEARAHFEAALRINPTLAAAHVNLGNALALIPGRTSDAVAQYRQALELSPDLVQAHFGWANTLAGLPGQESETLAQYEWALRIDPSFVPARVNLAGRLARIPGREIEAIAAYSKVLLEHPELSPVHYNLAIVLSRLPGRSDEAIAEYREALRINPGYAEAEKNLGIEYARRGQWDQATAHWKRALEINPGYTDLRKKLEGIDPAGGP